MVIFNWLFSKPKRYPVVQTDEIYPLHFLDNLATSRVIVLSETLLFHDVLDPLKLRDGLTDLIANHGDWRKLGGRLRMRASDGNLELHVPKEFDEQRPAIRFTKQAFDSAIGENRIGSQFPRPSLDGRPSVQPGPGTFDPFSALGNGPSTLEEYLCSDEPILRVHVTSFTDATVVVLLWPHAVAGALGVKNILSAWSRSLRGDGSVPPLLGASEDVLDGISTNSDPKSLEPYSLSASEIKGWGFVKFLARLLWTVFRRPKIDSRALFLPHEFVTHLRQACLDELQQPRQAGNGHVGGKAPPLSAPFLSEGDVLTAWLSRFVAQTRGGGRPALIFNPLDITSRLDAPWEDQEQGGVYVQNMVGAMYTSVDNEVLLHKSLGELALAVRSSIQSLATDQQIRAQLRIFRSLGNNKSEPLYGDPGAQLVAFSNWTKFDLFNAVDFSPAVTLSSSCGNKASGLGPGKPVYMHCQSLGENRFLRDCFAITGKDAERNYWITAFLYPEDWAELRRYIDQTCQKL
ncbi:hypothetical protein V8F20_001534, partial [Naviculisporaceae sp. PSN 640]